MHDGEFVKAELKRRGKKTSWLVQNTPFTRGKVRNLLNKPNWQTDDLKVASRVLGINMFVYHAMELESEKQE